jgi:hypothetical protein
MRFATSTCTRLLSARVLFVGWCLCSASAASVAAAQAIEAHADPGLLVGAKLGAGASFNGFGFGYVAELELGYLLPLPDPVRHALQLFAAAAYTAPHLSDRAGTSDPRLPGDGIAHFSIDQSVLAVTVGVLGRLPLPSKVVSPYLALGYRGYVISSQVRGDVAGQSFGTNTEHGYQHGFYAAVGADVFVGPGAVLAELQLAYAQPNALTLRDANVGALQLLVGYRLMFGGPTAAARAAEAGSVQGAGSTRAAPASAAVKPADAQLPAAEPAPVAATPDEPPSNAESVEAPNTGQIRGNVRSFKGAPLKATVVVQPEGLRTSTSAEGTFSLDVAAGRHTVRLRAQGYQSQSREVVVDEGGITVLNVELSEH